MEEGQSSLQLPGHICGSVGITGKENGKIPFSGKRERYSSSGERTGSLKKPHSRYKGHRACLMLVRNISPIRLSGPESKATAICFLEKVNTAERHLSEVQI